MLFNLLTTFALIPDIIFMNIPHSTFASCLFISAVSISQEIYPYHIRTLSSVEGWNAHYYFPYHSTITKSRSNLFQALRLTQEMCLMLVSDSNASSESVGSTA